MIAPHTLNQRSYSILALVLFVATVVRLTTPHLNYVDLPVVAFALNIVAIVALWLIAYRYFGAVPSFLAGLTYVTNLWIIYLTQNWFFSLLQVISISTILLAMLYAENVEDGLPFFVFIVLALITLTWCYFLTTLLRDDAPQTEKRVPLSGIVSWVITSDGILMVLEDQIPEADLKNIPPIPVFWMPILIGSALLGLPALWLQYRQILPAFVIWVPLPLLFFFSGGFFVRDIIPYLAVIVPSVSLLTGIGVAWLIKVAPTVRLSQIVILMIIIIALCSQILWWHTATRYIDEQYWSERLESIDR